MRAASCAHLTGAPRYAGSKCKVDGDVCIRDPPWKEGTGRCTAKPQATSYLKECREPHEAGDELSVPLEMDNHVVGLQDTGPMHATPSDPNARCAAHQSQEASIANSSSIA
mmetsp:Transcript_96515/g.166338  ORF Transcript_96515/g.166338 Transcript_96515/m.166338 type:complete len:111 (+) Transcript_96515:855-1187(+)